MDYVLSDSLDVRAQLLPLTYTRPVGALRIGIFTMAERWEALLGAPCRFLTEPYLAEMFPTVCNVDKNDPAQTVIEANIVATESLAKAVMALKPGERLRCADRVIASRGGEPSHEVFFEGEVVSINHVYDLFVKNDYALKLDFGCITAGRTSAPIHPSVTVIGDSSHVFLEEGASALGCVINVLNGPVYIGHDATVMEGCSLRGPVALCEHAQCNMGTKVYGPTTIGPWSKVGGELNNVVITGYTNKAHDGFLGNAVLGEWCNLGAGTVASNLKNDYSEIKLWNYPAGRFLRTGLQFCGLIMGDHSKSAINTSFNTATTVGVGCNIISEGMPRVFIPSFLKGGTSGFDNVNLNEFFTVASRVMARRGIALSDAHKRMYQAIFDMADRYK